MRGDWGSDSRVLTIINARGAMAGHWQLPVAAHCPTGRQGGVRRLPVRLEMPLLSHFERARPLTKET